MASSSNTVQFFSDKEGTAISRTVQFFLDKRAALKQPGVRLVLVESSLSEDVLLPRELDAGSYDRPEPTQAFSHETIKMMMAVREEQVDKLRELIKPTGAVFPLVSSSGSLWANITVGRGTECIVILSDQTVSTQHAQIEIDQPEHPCTLTDLASTNGTFINGERMQPHYPVVVHTGDCLRFGQAIFYLLSVELFSKVLDAITA